MITLNELIEKLISIAGKDPAKRGTFSVMVATGITDSSIPIMAGIVVNEKTKVVELQTP